MRRGHRDMKSIAAGPRRSWGARPDRDVRGGRAPRTGELGAKPGVGKLAPETGVLRGSHRDRRTARAQLKKLQFPKVTVQHGDLIRFEKVEEVTGSRPGAASDAVFTRSRRFTTACARRTGARRRSRRRGSRSAVIRVTPPRRLLVHRGQRAEAVPVVAGDDQRPGRLVAVALFLSERRNWCSSRLSGRAGRLRPAFSRCRLRPRRSAPALAQAQHERGVAVRLGGRPPACAAVAEEVSRTTGRSSRTSPSRATRSQTCGNRTRSRTAASS